MTDTSRIVLVPLTEKHIDLTYEWVKHPEFQRLFLMRDEPTQETHRVYFERILQDNTQYIYAIILEGRHIGNCGIKNIKTINSEGELWIYIGDSALRGRGIGKHATGLLIQKGFEVLGLNVLYVHVAEFNTVAIRMYEHLGFVVDKSQNLSSEWQNRIGKVIRMRLKSGR